MMNLQQARNILNISQETSREDARRAYLRLTKKFKPEIDPAGFARLRAAWDLVDALLATDDSANPSSDVSVSLRTQANIPQTEALLEVQHDAQTDLADEASAYSHASALWTSTELLHNSFDGLSDQQIQQLESDLQNTSEYNRELTLAALNVLILGAGHEDLPQDQYMVDLITNQLRLAQNWSGDFGYLLAKYLACMSLPKLRQRLKSPALAEVTKLLVLAEADEEIRTQKFAIMSPLSKATWNVITVLTPGIKSYIKSNLFFAPKIPDSDLRRQYRLARSKYKRLRKFMRWFLTIACIAFVVLYIRLENQIVRERYKISPDRETNLFGYPTDRPYKGITIQEIAVELQVLRASWTGKIPYELASNDAELARRMLQRYQIIEEIRFLNVDLRSPGAKSKGILRQVVKEVNEGIVQRILALRVLLRELEEYLKVAGALFE